MVGSGETLCDSELTKKCSQTLDANMKFSEDDYFALEALHEAG